MIFYRFFLNFLITAVSLTAFSINNNYPQYRLQSTFTILLSAISLKWTIINRSLPSISYLTLLDAYQIANIAFICSSSIWHALDSQFFLEYKLDFYMFSVFLSIFIFKHVIFFIWIYTVNKKKRELEREEAHYFAINKKYFLPNEKV